MAVLGLVGALLLTPVLAWISPVLVVLVGVVVGISWLCYAGADPVHWGPVPVASPGMDAVSLTCATNPTIAPRRTEHPWWEHRS